MTSLIIFYINLLSLFLSNKWVFYSTKISLNGFFKAIKCVNKCVTLIDRHYCHRDSSHKSISRHLVYTTHFRLTRMTSHGKRRSWSTYLNNDMDVFLCKIFVIKLTSRRHYIILLNMFRILLLFSLISLKKLNNFKICLRTDFVSL